MLFQALIIGGALFIGALIGYILKKLLTEESIQSAQKKAHKIIEEGREKQKQVLLEAQNQALKVIDDAKNEERQRRQEITDLQSRLEKRETMVDNKILEFESKQQR